MVFEAAPCVCGAGWPTALQLLLGAKSFPLANCSAWQMAFQDSQGAFLWGHIGLLCRYGNEHSKRKGCCHYCLIKEVLLRFIAERWEGVDSRDHVSCERLAHLHKPSATPSDHIKKNPASTEKDHY